MLEHFESRDGAQVKQEVVMTVLQLNINQKIQATNAVKMAFPNSIVIRKGTGPDRIQLYKNIGRRPCSTSISTSDASLELNESPEITNIKTLIGGAVNELDVTRNAIEDYLSNENFDKNVLKALFDKQLKVHARLQELNDLLTNILQKSLTELTLKQSQCENLCASEVDQLHREISVFTAYLNLELGSKTPTESGLIGCFSKLTSDVRENCPLLFHILHTIFLEKTDSRPVSEFRVKSVVHALAILVSLRSQKLTNDFKLMFTYLCISFGAGFRFIAMMNHLGLTVSWDKAMKFFDDQQKKQEEEITRSCPADVPVILMIDNINIYRGKRKHLRLLKSAGPTMWNFTAQALFLPNVDGIRELFNEKKSCITPQGSAIDMEADDIFLENDEEKAKLFNSFVDRYLLELLDVALNKLSLTADGFKELSEKQVESYIANASNLQNTKKYPLEIPKAHDLLPNAAVSSKSNVHILPLSLEDNSTIFGTMSILDKLAKDFSLPQEKKDAECLPFSITAVNFDVNSSRAHFELQLSQKCHKQQMKQTESQMRSTNKTFDGLLEEGSDDDL